MIVDDIVRPDEQQLGDISQKTYWKKRAGKIVMVIDLSWVRQVS
jgi:hypothetical protein